MSSGTSFVSNFAWQKPLFDSSLYTATVPDTKLLHKLVLNYHNNYRNQLASGSLMNLINISFVSASRMRELIWDEELAYTARMHASTVSFKHSECHAVDRFPFVGQVLGLVGASKKARSVADVLNQTLITMFEEYLDVENPDALVAGFNASRDYSVGHFSVMANDRVSRVGCGIATATHCSSSQVKGFCHFVTCHYDMTNVQHSYVYKTGEPTSACNDWQTVSSSKYKCLCKNTGTIFPVDHGAK